MTGADGAARVSVTFRYGAKGMAFGIDGVSFVAEMENARASSSVVVPVRARSDALIGIRLLF